MSATEVSGKEIPLSPTTGEPMTAIARRSRIGLWTLIVMDVSGTLALIVSYAYLWSLNVNNAWAPPGARLTPVQTNNTIPKRLTGSFAPEWPFWAILGAIILATIAMWVGYRGLRRGHHGRMIAGSTIALLIVIVTLAAQWVQISTLPFKASDGAYASAVLLLLGANIAHLLLLLFLLLGIVNRARKRLISVAVPFQAQLMSYWMTWICIAFLLGAICTTFMVESPNVDPAVFGTFDQK